ncbi:MAG: DUF3261 domain-containing protein [SAR324 cluster bacterium]|nr:DUF3261 domain-containing protein [SAR324 cluster bacterium]
MMKFFQAAALTLSFLGLVGFSGCTNTQRVTSVMLGAQTNATFSLEQPSSFGGEFFATQRLEVSYLDKKTAKKIRQEVVVQVEIDDESMRLVALGQMGISLFQLSWDGSLLKVQKPPGVLLPFAPEYLIANMQLALWKEFPNNPSLMIEETKDKRVLKFAGKPALVITYPKGKGKMQEIRINDLTRNFKIFITRLD